MAIGVGQRCVVRIKITGVELRNAKDIVATVESPQYVAHCQEVSFDEVSGLVYVAVDVNSAGSYFMWLEVRFAEEVVYTPAFVFAEVEGEATPCDAPYIVDVEVAGESVSVTPPSITPSGGDVAVLFATTHSELKAKRDAGQLVAGAFYRITDYECTTVQADSRSANHPFDIIVQALDERTLSENAQAIQRDGDTYFANAKLESWQLKYALDNDASRFAWAKERIIEQPARWSCGWGVLEERYDDGASANYTTATIDGVQKYLYRPSQPTSYLEGKTFYRYEGQEILHIEDASELYFVTRGNPFETGEQTEPLLVIYAPTGRIIRELEVTTEYGETSDENDESVWNTYFGDELDMKTYGQTIDINGETYYSWVPWSDDNYVLDEWVFNNSPFVLNEGTKIVYNGSTDSLYYAFDGIIGKFGGNVYEVTDGNHIYKYEDEVYGEEYLLDTISYTNYIAPREGGKGVIYRLIDEHNNDCPFDFKNMQFLHNGEWYYTFSYFGEDASLGDYCANNHLVIVSDQKDQLTTVTTTIPRLVFNLIHNASDKFVAGILNNDVQSSIAKGFIQGARISGNKWLPTGGGNNGYFKKINIYSSGLIYGNIFRGYANGFVVGSADKPIEQFYGNTMTLSIINNFNITIDCTNFTGNTYNVLISGTGAKSIVGGYIKNCYFDDYGSTDEKNAAGATQEVKLKFESTQTDPNGLTTYAISNCYIRLFNALAIKYGETTSNNAPLRFLNIDARGWGSGTTITIPSTFPANANYELKVAKNSKGEIKMWCDADFIQ